RLSHASPSTAAIYRCAYALPALGALARLEGRRHGPRAPRPARRGRRRGLLRRRSAALAQLDRGRRRRPRDRAGQRPGGARALSAWALLRERPARALLPALPVATLGVVLISGALEAHAYGRAPLRGAPRAPLSRSPPARRRRPTERRALAGADDFGKTGRTT